MAEQSILYGEARLSYRVNYNPRRSTRMAIHVLPDGSVVVDAPPGVDSARIRQAVQKRAQWVARHLEKYGRLREYVLPREYVSGESHFYLGRRYLLKVVRSDNGSPSTKLVRGSFRVVTPDTSAERVRDLLWGWYLEHARAYFQGRLEALAGQLGWLSQPPRWRLRSMKRQWGSCSPQGVLTLNPHLVKAPGRCVEYVLLHELCHLREHNHSQRFYRLLARQMPDWKQVKAHLDESAELYLNC
jgi:hypothetical protein